MDVLIADPCVLAIPVKENHEPLIDLVSQSAITLGPSPEIDNNTDYTKMRKTVYEKLLFAQRLLPKNIKFCLYEGYRSLNLQQFLFESRQKNVLAAHPTLSGKALFDEVIRMVSPVVNYDGSLNIPPHSTGAAVDIYLVDENGDYLDMGIHPKDWLSDTDGMLSRTDAENISAEAKQNRKILSEVMTKAGFVNYCTEFWHWSYGDRYWAFQTQQPHAIYGVIDDKGIV